MYESNDKMVSHPEHYKGENGMEVIDVIENFVADLRGIEASDTANIIKYACRWKHKGGRQDLEKVMWYCQHLIDYLDKKDLKERVKVDAEIAGRIDRFQENNAEKESK